MDKVVIYYKEINHLPPKEQSRQGRILLKQLFLDFFGVELDEHDIGKEAGGKPFYTKNPKCYFNISHCRDYVAAAVSTSAVGIDIESDREVSASLLKRVVSKEERDFVIGKDTMNGRKLSKEQAKRFLSIWTKKESIVKMTGEGITCDLSKVSVRQEQLYTLQQENLFLSVCVASAQSLTCDVLKQ